MNKKQPTTMQELLKAAQRPLWSGTAYYDQAVRHVEMFIEVVGDLRLTRVNQEHLDAFVEALKAKGNSAATINRKLVNVNQVLGYALTRQWITTTPKVEWEKAKKTGRIRWLSTEEEEKMFFLLKKWGEDEVAKFLLILLDTGMRRGELLTLTPKQIDAPWIRLWKTKNALARSVPMSPRVQRVLEGFQGWTVTESKLRVVWAKLKSEMNLDNDHEFVLHMLRHTAATRTLSKTKSLKTVQKLLGHSDIKTTMIYAHLADQELLAAVGAE